MPRMARMNIKTGFIFSLLLTVFLASPLTSAFALDLDQAKQQGLVGETGAGYIAAVAPNPEAQELVKRINAERKERYLAIAKKNGTPVAAVEALAGKKAIEMTPSGQFIQNGGAWVKK